MSFFHAGPEAIELGAEKIGFVEQDGRVRKQIENTAVSSGDGSVELPAGKDGDAAGADGGFDNFFRRTGDAFAAEARVNCAEQLIADGSFGEREQERFVEGIRRPLRGGIEAADGFDFVAEEFDADGALGFGRIHVEDAAAQGVFAGHFDDIGGGVADGVQMGEKIIDVEGFSATEDAGQVGVVVGGALQDGGGRDRSDHDRGFAGGDLPQSGRAFFLQLGMRRKILKGEHVAGGERDDRVGIGGGGEFTESLEDGDEIFDGAVVVDDNDEGTVGVAAQKHEQQGFCSG